jgi:hypothetical protein
MLQVLRSSRIASASSALPPPTATADEQSDCSHSAESLENSPPRETIGLHSKVIAKSLRKRLKDVIESEDEMTCQELVSAYDRMRTRKFARMLLEGVKTSVAAEVAEKEAIESLAMLARERGILPVVRATKGAIVTRSSCAGRLLKRQSICTAAMDAVSSANSSSRKRNQAEVEKVSTSAASSRRRLRRRASLLRNAPEPETCPGRECSPSVEEDEVSHQSIDESTSSPQ